MAYETLFFWRMFLGQRIGLRVVARRAALLGFTPASAFLHRFIKRTVRIVRGNHLRFLMAGTCDGEHDSIVAYNAPFEINRFRELAEFFPITRRS